MSPRVILQGVTGSTAYGLAREGSDIDRLGVFTVPPRELLGLGWSARKESIVWKKPDSTHHELGKFVRLAMKGNPTVTELLWLDDYEVRDYVFGEPLISQRNVFLSQRTVRAAYLGYATDQLKRAESRSDESFSSGTKGRPLKHARHCMRLLEQARALWQTGVLPIRVAWPEEYFYLDGLEWGELIATLRNHMDHTAWLLDNRPSPLPDTVDTPAVRDLLDSLRAAQNWYGERGREIQWSPDNAA